jgi:hypothetical protein
VRSIVTQRIVLAGSNRCDEVDPDNVDEHDNNNGLGMTNITAIDYMTFLADQAHSQGLAVGLKNVAEIVGSVLPYFRWQGNEECLQYQECDVF